MVREEEEQPDPVVKMTVDVHAERASGSVIDIAKDMKVIDLDLRQEEGKAPTLDVKAEGEDPKKGNRVTEFDLPDNDFGYHSPRAG